MTNNYYSKNMSADVTAFVNGCEGCQDKKLQRAKTRLPMIITDTRSRSVSKVSLDNHGPLRKTP